MKSFLLILCIIIASITNAQTYDLIVFNSGDSLACHIDSVFESKIYFNMRNDHKWVNTNTDLNKILLIRYDTIHKSDYTFKSGTSYILSKKIIIKPKSIKEIRKNSLFVEFSVFDKSFNIQRFIPVTNKTAIGFNIGLHRTNRYLYDSGIKSSVKSEISFLFGGPIKFFESGLALQFHEDSEKIMALRLGYRYQYPKGLFVRLNAQYYFNTKRYDITLGDPFPRKIPWPTVSIGYAFHINGN